MNSVVLIYDLPQLVVLKEGIKLHLIHIKVQNCVIMCCHCYRSGPVFAGRSSRTSMDSPPFLTAALPAEKVEEVAGKMK